MAGENNSGWRLRPIGPTDRIDLIIDFCEGHLVPPFNKRQDVFSTLLGKAESNDDIYDLHFGSERKAVGIATKRGSNDERNTWELMIMGGSEIPKEATLLIFEKMLKQAKNGGHEFIEILWCARNPIKKDDLVDLGFSTCSRVVEIYGTFEQGLEVLEKLKPPEDFEFTWISYDDSRTTAFFEFYMKYFAENAAFAIENADSFHTSLSPSNMRTRLMLDPSGKIVGFVVLRLDDEFKGTIVQIGRDPTYPKKGLGFHLLYECIRVLSNEGARYYWGYVPLENVKALNVYRAFTQIKNEFEMLQLKV